MTTETQERQLSGAELREALYLAAASDSVELKLTIPDAAQRSTVSALQLDPLDAQIRQVFFFDTPDLACNAAGVVVRARRVRGRGDDSVVKLRPVVPDQLPIEVRTSRNTNVEVDAMPGGFVCSASYKNRMKRPLVRKTVLGGGPNSKLFSKGQRAFFEQNAPDGIELDELHVLGPLFVLKLKSSPTGYDGSLAAEMWLYPDGSRILELSTRCAPGDMMLTALKARSFLESRGIELSGEQQTKTKTALEFFENELQSAANKSAASKSAADEPIADDSESGIPEATSMRPARRGARAMA